MFDQKSKLKMQHAILKDLFLTLMVSFPPPFSFFMERDLSSFVLLAIDLALRAFVDHLVVLWLKKVASTPMFCQCTLEVLAFELGVSSTSDNNCISVNMFMNSWNQVSPSKLKNVTTLVCINLAPILLVFSSNF